ncbi:MAG: carboxypeptidase regulatory-like domain-containing protein [Candidatus Zixiibacteriota bacterium]|nr:MAG: carboxypeptidase regulatory-like domain-containing protein [candidate division Zixibacteria bacterium]
MKVLKKLLAIPILAISLILFFPVSAVSGTLTGTVIDNFYSNPVPDVEVSVFQSDSTLAGIDTTDVNGVYALTLSAGEYYAVFSKENYADTTISDITITPEGTTLVDLTFRFTHNCQYVVGDVNGSWSLNGLDVMFGVAYFEGGPAPINCLCECTPGHIWNVCGDANGSCFYNGLDITYLITIYQGGPWVIPCPDCPPIN